MSRNKILIALLVLLLIAGAAWYWGSPAYALSRLKDAVVEGDKGALAERIDFPRLRGSLNSEMRVMKADEMAKPENTAHGFAALGTLIGMAMMDPANDGLVTPEAMASMIKRGKLQRAKDAVAEPAGVAANWSIERDGFNRFTARPQVPAGERVPTMVFELDGLNWKLVAIDLADGRIGGDEI